MDERTAERSAETETARRVALARVVTERKRAEMGEKLLAVACYGSVAHGAAGPHSDLELVLLTDDTLELTYEPFMMDGVQGQCDILPASRMLHFASRVRPKWGIEADQFRCHLVLWDPHGWFARIQAAANHLADDEFAVAQREGWWSAYEIRNKVRNALLAADAPRAIYHAWEFAYSSAMRIALHDRQPYESDRTIWTDVAGRAMLCRISSPRSLLAISPRSPSRWTPSGSARAHGARQAQVPPLLWERGSGGEVTSSTPPRTARASLRA